MKILITGTAGFIGFHLANRLIGRGDTVVGLDSINDYYDINLKYDRLAQAGIRREEVTYGRFAPSRSNGNYRFIQLALEDRPAITDLLGAERFDVVVNLAAQAGVRYSLINPYAYIDTNIVGFGNILEGCRQTAVKHLVYASSSSVYGLNQKMPFSTADNVDHPVSLYAASKKSNELMAHSYSHLFGLPTTGLRFFTAYGPWGRPDMALFLFTEAMLRGEPIKVFNHGKMRRDFTYIDDLVEGVVRVIDRPPAGNAGWDNQNPDPATSPAPYRTYNIGNQDPVELLDFIRAIERELGIVAEKQMLPIQPGDIPASFADSSDLAHDLGYRPDTPVAEGIRRFIQWYLDYYKVDRDPGFEGQIQKLAVKPEGQRPAPADRNRKS